VSCSSTRNKKNKSFVKTPNNCCHVFSSYSYSSVVACLVHVVSAVLALVVVSVGDKFECVHVYRPVFSVGYAPQQLDPSAVSLQPTGSREYLIWCRLISDAYPDARRHRPHTSYMFHPVTELANVVVASIDNNDSLSFLVLVAMMVLNAAADDDDNWSNAEQNDKYQARVK